MDRQSMRRHLPSLSFTIGFLVLLLLLGAAFVYSGVYNVAADVPHTRPVYALLDGLRDRSIAAHARDITPPADLASPQRVSAGAGLYGEMCVGCHLGPGIAPNELSKGIYPQAPDFTKPQEMSAAEQFWAIKHGIKLSAMPAWGKTHPDPLIWNLVAFVRRLPGMTPEEYERLTANAPEEHDEAMEEAPAAK